VDLIQQLKPKVHSYSPDWSAAYGLFRRGLAPYTFSYLTSLVYHWQEENDFTYEAVAITEGHPVQIEYAGVPDTCLSCGIGQSFVGFLTEPAIQKIIMEKNFMLPVVRGIAEKAPYFQDLPHLKLLPPDGMEQFVDGKATLLQDWERASR
jgi:thiamine transport system substrate-binding protein